MVLIRPVTLLVLFALSSIVRANRGQNGMSQGNSQQMPGMPSGSQQMPGMPSGSQQMMPGGTQQMATRGMAGLPQMSRPGGFQASFGRNSAIKQRFVRSPQDDGEVEMDTEMSKVSPPPPPGHRGPPPHGPHHHHHHHNGQPKDEAENE